MACHSRYYYYNFAFKKIHRINRLTLRFQVPGVLGFWGFGARGWKTRPRPRPQGEKALSPPSKDNNAYRNSLIGHVDRGWDRRSRINKCVCLRLVVLFDGCRHRHFRHRYITSQWRQRRRRSDRWPLQCYPARQFQLRRRCDLRRVGGGRVLLLQRGSENLERSACDSFPPGSKQL